MNSTPLSARFGLRRISAVSPKVFLADPMANVKEIIRLLEKDEYKSSEFIVFPELCITGYTAADLFFQDSILDNALEALNHLVEKLKGDHRLVLIGVPLRHEGRLFNCAAALCDGKILGFIPKSHIPNYQEFYEKRWFSSGNDIQSPFIEISGKEIPVGNDILFRHEGVVCGAEICEDLWVPIPPSSYMAQSGALLIMNLSATNEIYGKHEYLQSIVATQSSRCRCAYAYASAGKGESSTDLVFSGNAIIAYDGKIIKEARRFSYGECGVSCTLDFEKLRNDRRKYSSFYDESNFGVFRIIDSGICTISDNSNIAEDYLIDPHPFVPESEETLTNKCNEIISIQSWGLAQRLQAINCHKLVVGISGGLDSTLALLVAVKTFKDLNLPAKNIYGITMPGKATTDRTHSNAMHLMEKLGVSILEIPIGPAVDQHFNDIDHNPEIKDAVYENSQARERTQILMDLANKVNGIVLGTGDLSELALGWCTYNGDHISMYNVNAGIPKTLVKHLVKWFADNSESELKATLLDVIDTPISPELIPADNEQEIAQKTEELVGPYELHDFFLYHVLRNGFSPTKIFQMAKKAFEGTYHPIVIKKWLREFYRRFFSQQFKRSCMPDGPKVGSVCLSPRGDWRMPSDASSRMWLEEVDNIPE